MKRVYVTERGTFDKYGLFQGAGVIGVDQESRLAVSYPLSLGFYRYKSHHLSTMNIIIYKDPFTNEGVRITAINVFPSL